MDQYGGIIDDARTLLEWRPILPLLAEWRGATDPLLKLRAAVRVAKFLVDVTEAGPRARAAVHAAEKLVAAMASDVALRDAIMGFLR